jgi:4-diphosphocytidyl-2-C-methyl-D-erythritol kinase
MSQVSSVCKPAYAKINLSLEVLGRLPDGYHELLSVMQQVQLHDDLWIRHREVGQISITCDLPGVPLDSSNLVWRAAELLRNRYGLSYGAEFQIIKRIPVAGGLAGGSSDAAAALEGLNEIWKLDLNQDELLQLGKALGMDVPFCLLGGTALATEKGQRLAPLPPPPPWLVVLANPGVGVSTKEAFQSLDEIMDYSQPRTLITPQLASALEAGRSEEICQYFYNDFEAMILQRLPVIRRIKETMLACGALGALLSGSGPSVFCVVESLAQAEGIVEVLRNEVPFITITSTVRRVNSYDE